MKKEQMEICKLRLSLELSCHNCKYHKNCFPVPKKNKVKSRKGVHIII